MAKFPEIYTFRIKITSKDDEIEVKYIKRLMYDGLEITATKKKLAEEYTEDGARVEVTARETPPQVYDWDY